MERSSQQGSEFKNGKKRYLGTFTKARDAAMAYDEANVKNDKPARNAKKRSPLMGLLESLQPVGMGSKTILFNSMTK